MDQDAAFKRRLSVAGASGMLIEGVNKLAPFFIYHLAEQRLGVASFGRAMLGVAWAEILVPFIVFGFSQRGMLELVGPAPGGKRLGELQSSLMTLRGMHFLVVAGLLALGVASQQIGADSQVLILAIFGVLGSCVCEQVWFLVARRQVLLLNGFNLVAKLIGLICIVVLVHTPQDFAWFTFFSLLPLLIVHLGSFFYAKRYFRLPWPQREGLWRHWKGSCSYAGVVVLSILVERVDFLLVEHVLGAEGAGIYSGPTRMAHSFGHILGALSNAFFAEMLSLRRDVGELSRLLNQFLWALVLIGGAVVAGVWFVGDPLLVLVLSENYRGAGGLLVGALVGGLLVAAHQAMGNQILLGRGRTGSWVAVLGLGSVALLLVGWVAVNRYGLWGLMLAGIGVKAAMLCATGALVRREGVRIYGSVMVRALIPAGVMSLGLSWWCFDDVQLWSTVLVGAGVYIPTAWVLFPKRIRRIWGNLLR